MEIHLLFLCFVIILAYLLLRVYPKKAKLIYTITILLAAFTFKNIIDRKQREKFTNPLEHSTQFIPIEQRLQGSTDIYYVDPAKPKEFTRDLTRDISGNPSQIKLEFKTQVIPKLTTVLNLYAAQGDDYNASYAGFPIEQGSGAFLDLGVVGKFSFQDPQKNPYWNGFYVLPISWDMMSNFQRDAREGELKLREKLQKIARGTSQSQSMRQDMANLRDVGYLAVFSQGSIAGIPKFVGTGNYNSMSRAAYLLKRDNAQEAWTVVRSEEEGDLPAQINGAELDFAENREKRLQVPTSNTMQSYQTLSAYLALASSKGQLNVTSAKVIQCPFPLYTPDDPNALVNGRPQNGFLIRGFVVKQDGGILPLANQYISEDPTMNFLGMPIQTGTFGLKQQSIGDGRWGLGGYPIQENMNIVGRTILKLSTAENKIVPQAVKFLVKSTGNFKLYRFQYQNTQSTMNFGELCVIDDANTCEKESHEVSILNSNTTLDLFFEWSRRQTAPSCTGGDQASFSIQMATLVAGQWSEFSDISVSQLEIPKLLDLTYDSEGIFESSRVYLTAPNGKNIAPQSINAPMTSLIRNYPKIQWVIESFQMAQDNWNLYDESAEPASVDDRRIHSLFVRIRSRAMKANDAVYYLKVDEKGQLGVTLDGGSFGTAWMLGKLPETVHGVQMVTLRSVMMDLGMIKDVNTQTSGFGQVTRMGKYLSYSFLPTNAGTGNKKTSLSMLLRSNVQLTEQPVPWTILNVVESTEVYRPPVVTEKTEEAPSEPACTIEYSGSAKDSLCQLDAYLRENPNKLTQVGYVYQLNLTNPDGKFVIDAKNMGTRGVRAGQAANPDTTVTISNQDWLDIRDGKLDAAPAVLTGRVRVTGNLQALMKLQSLQ